MIAQLRGSTPELGTSGYLLVIAQQLVDVYTATTTTLACLPEDVLRAIAAHLPRVLDRYRFARVLRLDDIAAIASNELKIFSFCDYCRENLRALCLYRLRSRCRIYADWSPFAGDSPKKLVSEIFVYREHSFSKAVAEWVARDMYARGCMHVRLSAHMCDVVMGEVVEIDLLPTVACLV